LASADQFGARAARARRPASEAVSRTEDGFRKEDITMADPSRDKRERAAKATYEAEAQLLREKTARLRELRLAREAADAAGAQ